MGEMIELSNPVVKRDYKAEYEQAVQARLIEEDKLLESYHKMLEVEQNRYNPILKDGKPLRPIDAVLQDQNEPEIDLGIKRAFTNDCHLASVLHSRTLCDGGLVLLDPADLSTDVSTRFQEVFDKEDDCVILHQIARYLSNYTDSAADLFFIDEKSLIIGKIRTHIETAYILDSLNKYLAKNSHELAVALTAHKIMEQLSTVFVIE